MVQFRTMKLSCRYRAALLLALAGCVPATVVKEELTLTWEWAAPNGQAREMIMMNGQFPGPTFTWDEDDDVEVVVHNQMPFNTTIHWHGLMYSAMKSHHKAWPNFVQDAGYAVVRRCAGPDAKADRGESVVHLSLQSVATGNTLVSSSGISWLDRFPDPL